MKSEEATGPPLNNKKRRREHGGKKGCTTTKAQGGSVSSDAEKPLSPDVSPEAMLEKKMPGRLSGVQTFQRAPCCFAESVLHSSAALRHRDERRRKTQGEGQAENIYLRQLGTSARRWENGRGTKGRQPEWRGRSWSEQDATVNLRCLTWPHFVPSPTKGMRPATKPMLPQRLKTSYKL